MGAVLGKMFNLNNLTVGLVSGIIPSLVYPLLVFGMRLSPFDNTFDLFRYILTFIGVFLIQLFGVNANDAKYPSNKSQLTVSTVNTSIISALFIASHYAPLVGQGLTTLKSTGWKGELLGNTLSLGVISAVVFILNNILKDTAFVGGLLNNRYTMIISIIALIGATYFASMNHVYFTSSPIQYPLKKALSMMPAPVRFATPVALQIVNPDILNQIKVDTPEQKEAVDALRGAMGALLNSLPVDINGAVQKVDTLIKQSPVDLGITTNDIIAQISGVDIRQPGMIETVIKDPMLGIFIKLFKSIKSSDYLSAVSAVPAGEQLINTSLSTLDNVMKGGYYY